MPRILTLLAESRPEENELELPEQPLIAVDIQKKPTPMSLQGKRHQVMMMKI